MAEKGKNKEKETTPTSSAKKSDLLLPQAKVKTIMKSSPEIELIGSETLYLITKSTELFIEYLAKQAFDSSKGKSLTYKNLADYINKYENMAFLKDIVPQTMTAKAALLEVARQNASMNKEILE
jgi:chromatin accessibility complex protein 1